MNLVLCLAPLLIIVIGLKFLLLVEESGREVNHVKEEAKKPHTYKANVYEDKDKAEEEEDDWT